MRTPSLLPVLALFSAALSSPLGAQATLRVTSANIVLPTPTAYEYDAGYSRIGELTYEVTGCPVERSCSVGLWAASASFGAGLDIERVEWRLDGGGGDRWTPLSTLPSDDNVEIVGGDIARGTIHFRVRLAWNEDVGGRSYLGHLRLGLTQR